MTQKANNKPMKKLLTIVAVIVLTGCQTFYSGIVTVTEVRKSVMNEYGKLYRAGQVSEDTVAKVRSADAQYLAAADSLRLALLMYKAGTTTNDPALKLEEVKAPVQAIITVITPLIGKVIANQYGNSLTKATQL